MHAAKTSGIYITEFDFEQFRLVGTQDYIDEGDI